MKRGQLTLQFHWIFALVGGILFLLFFFILIQSLTSGEGSRQERQLSSSIETILQSAPTNPDTFTVVDTAMASYRLYCEDEASQPIKSYLRVNGGNYLDEEIFRYVPLFSPAEIKGDQIFTNTRTWNAPFPVGSLVMVSNNRTRYVLVAPSNAVSDARAFLEEENLGGYGFDVIGSGSVSTYTDEGFDQYRFIYYGMTPSFASIKQEFKHSGNTALAIRFNPDGESGTLTFYDNLGSGGIEQAFYGKAMLSAAIFSQDLDTFQCNMAKASERLNTARRILLVRLDKLPQNENCTHYYGQAKSLLENYPSPRQSGRFNEAIQQGGTIEQLQQLNMQLLTKGCPRLY